MCVLTIMRPKRVDSPKLSPYVTPGFWRCHAEKVTFWVVIHKISARLLEAVILLIFGLDWKFVNNPETILDELPNQWTDSSSLLPLSSPFSWSAPKNYLAVSNPRLRDAFSWQVGLWRWPSSHCGQAQKCSIGQVAEAFGGFAISGDVFLLAKVLHVARAMGRCQARPEQSVSIVVAMYEQKKVLSETFPRLSRVQSQSWHRPMPHSSHDLKQQLSPWHSGCVYFLCQPHVWSLVSPSSGEVVYYLTFQLPLSWNEFHRPPQSCLYKTSPQFGHPRLLPIFLSSTYFGSIFLFLYTTPFFKVLQIVIEWTLDLAVTFMLVLLLPALMIPLATATVTFGMSLTFLTRLSLFSTWPVTGHSWQSSL